MAGTFEDPGPTMVTLGGIDKPLKSLPARANEVWKGKFAGAISGRLVGLGSLDDAKAIGDLLTGVTDVQVELICAYDVDGLLGGADWILDHATAREIWEAFKTIVRDAFPFLDDAGRAPATVAWLLPQIERLRQGILTADQVEPG